MEKKKSLIIVIAVVVVVLIAGLVVTNMMGKEDKYLPATQHGCARGIRAGPPTDRPCAG